MLTEAYETTVLPPSFSHTILISKVAVKEKFTRVKNHRPIAMGNVDYKIFMKVLVRRLQTVIHRIVGAHQTGGIKGRTIFRNVNCTLSVLECCDTELNQVAMLHLKK